MKVQLLILLALAGPFCGITRASPTELPTNVDSATVAVPDVAEGPSEDTHDVITGPPSTQPEAVPAQVATETAKVATEAPTEDATEAATETATDSATGSVMAKATEGESFTTEVVVTAAATDSEGEWLVTAAATESEGADATQEVPVVKTVVPTAVEVGTQAAEKTETGEMGADVVVEDEGLSSGQVVGIVIGALVAVVIVIAVVIALVRRMGKYSP